VNKRDLFYRLLRDEQRDPDLFAAPACPQKKAPRKKKMDLCRVK
jgi:hypothetical protein